jgi:hypothetical protein
MSPKKYMSSKNFGGGPERSQRVPPNPQKPNPEGQAGSPNPEGEVINPEGEVNKGGGISRRSALKGLGVLGVLGVLALSEGLKGCGEREALSYYENQVNEFLKGAVPMDPIRGIQFYVDTYYSSRLEGVLQSGLLLAEVIKGLKPIIYSLPDKIVGRIKHIVLVIVPDNSPTPDDSPISGFNSESYVDIGMRLAIYTNRFGVTSPEIENGISPEIEDRLAREFYLAAMRLCVFGDPNESSRRYREAKLEECKDSMNKGYYEKCIGLTDLTNSQSKRWLEISKQNGGYINSGYTTMSPFETYGLGPLVYLELPKYKNFGYTNDPESRYGRLNPFQDIACVFEKILSSIYKVIHREEDPEAVINALLSKTPGETGLHEKYLIACESLIKWYGENSDQSAILREFIQIIADAIKEAERSY